MKDEEENSKRQLNTEPTIQSWHNLSQVTLTQIILFNRRREGEVSQMKMSSYLQRDTNPMQDDILKSLSDFEKELCRTLARVEVRGKRGRKVPILLAPNMKDSVELLLKTRTKVGIYPENPYIFA